MPNFWLESSGFSVSFDCFQKMQVDQEEPHAEEQQPQTPAENKTESEEMEVRL